jgi:hypothetical protein
MPTHKRRPRSDLRQHARHGRLALKQMQEKKSRSPLDWRGPAARLKNRFMARPKSIDLRGLGAKLCELLGARPGDTIAFHVLQDGSVRVIDYSIAPERLRITCPAI